MTSTPLHLGKYSIGTGDRFSLQAEALVRACQLAARAGAIVVPVWSTSDLPSTSTVYGWTSARYVDAARHDPW